MRVLAVKRISRDTEQSSALERQEVRLAEAIRKGHHTLAGWVEDATVSGAVNLDKRPSLGKWLREPLIHEWDAMMVTEQDRITRDDLHWAAFVGWVLENNKTVIILDDPSFDLSTPNGRMIANIKATQAANYRNAVREKKLNQVKYYRDEQLWPGGTWPFGYRAVRVEHKGALRWRLDIDPVTGPLVREAYDRLVNQNWSMGRIAKDWNDRGVYTALDYQRHVNALEKREGYVTKVKGTKWSTSAVRAVMSKPSLVGYAVHKGAILKKNGLPVQWAEPILTREEFDKLQEVLSDRAKAYKNISREQTPMIGVYYCPCGEMFYSNSATRTLADGTIKHYSYYLCKTHRNPPKCAYTRSWERDVLEINLEEMFLGLAGDLEITTKTFVPGSDRSSEITELREALENLTGNLVHMKPGSAGAGAVIKAIEDHETALAELEALPVIPSRWVEEGTGETFRQYWQSHPDWTDRGDLLRRIGVRLYVGGSMKAPDLDLFLPEDLQKRITDALTNTVEPGYLREVNRLADEAIAERVERETAMQEEAIRTNREKSGQ